MTAATGRLAAMLEIQRHRGARAFDRGQRIHHDDAAVALDQRHVGDVEAAHLIDAGHDFEQPVVHVEPRLPPQARIHRRRRFGFGQEAIGLEAPDHPALRAGDPRMLQRTEKAARRFVEIARVGKRQRLQASPHAARARAPRRPSGFPLVLQRCLFGSCCSCSLAHNVCLSSWPGLTRPSTSFCDFVRTWMPGTRPGMTNSRRTRRQIRRVRRSTTTASLPS